jgi:hypothetical protein
MASFLEKIVGKKSNKYLKYLLLPALFLLVSNLMEWLIPIFPFQGVFQLYSLYENRIFSMVLIFIAINDRRHFQAISSLLFFILLISIYNNYIIGCLYFVLISYILEYVPDDESTSPS